MVHYTMFTAPANYTLDESIIQLQMAILGGLGNLPGSIIGAAVLVIAPEISRAFYQYRLLFVGIIMVTLMLFAPNGLLSRQVLKISWLHGTGNGRQSRQEEVKRLTEILKTENLSKSFAGLKALNHVSISIKKDEILGIIGPNGAGKTTFFNLISGFESSSGGKIIFSGNDMTQKGVTDFCKKGMARTFQNTRIFAEMTVPENLAAGMHNSIHTNLWNVVARNKKDRRIEAQVYEKCMDILKYLHIEHLEHEYAANLSYGYQRKTEIGRALASAPRLLLLDEPSAGMNDQETMELMELIRGINCCRETGRNQK